MKEVEVVIVTGMSGAGKTIALNYLEDMNYFVVDNVPYLIGNRLLKSVRKEELQSKKLALGMDIRSFSSGDEFIKLLDRLKEASVSYKVIYIDAEDNVILNRYNLSRRKHPLNEKTLLSSIEKERQVMSEIMELSDIVIDTSYLKPKELGQRVKETVSNEGRKKITLHLQSFGFKYGNPIDLDMMYDVRCLPNPYYVPELRVKTGNSLDVQKYVMNSKASEVYLEKICEMLEFLIPEFIQEGKNHLSIGIGCSGGKHRSVTFVNKIFDKFSKENDLEVIRSHREDERGNWD